MERERSGARPPSSGRSRTTHQRHPQSPGAANDERRRRAAAGSMGPSVTPARSLLSKGQGASRQSVLQSGQHPGCDKEVALPVATVARWGGGGQEASAQ